MQTENNKVSRLCFGVNKNEGKCQSPPIYQCKDCLSSSQIHVLLACINSAELFLAERVSNNVHRKNCLLLGICIWRKHHLNFSFSKGSLWFWICGCNDTLISCWLALIQPVSCAIRRGKSDRDALADDINPIFGFCFYSKTDMRGKLIDWFTLWGLDGPQPSEPGNMLQYLPFHLDWMKLRFFLN